MITFWTFLRVCVIKRWFWPSVSCSYCQISSKTTCVIQRQDSLNCLCPQRAIRWTSSTGSSVWQRPRSLQCPQATDMGPDAAHRPDRYALPAGSRAANVPRILLSWNVPVLKLHADDYLVHIAWVQMQTNLRQPSCARLSFPPSHDHDASIFFSFPPHVWEPSCGACCKMSLRLKRRLYFPARGLSSEGCRMSSVFSFLKQALGLFWHLCKCCFPAAALVFASQQTDLKLTQHQHSFSSVLACKHLPE